ncbi:MAG: phosphatidylglycerophosphatase A [Candidatus Marinimicrobia bacterium]|nr:phosphatidylglycerophosphatase A [Candidatus Neomarinimicrobiota bacterium]
MENNRPRRLSTAIGSLFGIGFFPVFPGTLASFVTALMAYLLARNVKLSLIWEIEIFLLILLTGLITAKDLIRHRNVRDPKWFVMDEVAGMWLAMIALPKDNFYVLVLVFFLFRVFDILKPWIIRKVDLLNSALAVMLDDILAAVPAWAGGFILWKLLW